MWLMQGLGIWELALLAAAPLVLCLFRTGRRWSVAVVPCLTIAALAPGTDPLCMLLISSALLGAFVAGVCIGPRLRAVEVR
ncbi:MAG: hypothetical protein ACP5XB_31680 [Isosphaeraceae bacterium]